MTRTRLKKAILCVLVLAALAFPVIAGDVDSRLDRYKGIPAYSLVIDAACPVVNGGDDFDIKLYISGAGDVDYAGISVTIPPELLAKNKNVSYSYISNVTDEGHIIQDKIETNRSRYRLELSPDCYKRYFISDIPREKQIPILIGEVDYETRPAFSINITIADDAPAGDHVITITHYYKYSDKWYIEENELEIHVNAWYEKGNFGHSHLSWQSLAIALTVVTILFTFIKYLNDIIGFIRNGR